MQPVRRFSPGQKWAETSADDMNRIVDAVNGLVGVIAPLSVPALRRKLAGEPGQKAFYKIVSNDGGGAYTVRRIFWSHDSSSFEEVDSTHPEYSVGAKDFGLRTSGVADQTVKGWWVRSDNALRLLVDLAGGGGGAMFAVQVTQTAGVAGDSATLCTYTYTVKTLDGATTLGTAKAPKKWRNTGAKRKMLAPTAGSIGLAYYDEDGAIQLFDANEAPAVTTCA